MVAKNALLFAALLASSMLSAGMGSWYGQVLINGTLAADGTLVCAYVNGVENSRASVGSCPGSHYCMTVIGNTGDNVTFKVFCDSNYPAKEGVQAWSASPPTNILNLTVDYASVEGNASDIVTNGTGTLNITINGTVPGNTTYYNDVETVTISSPSGAILSFGYNFSNSFLNLSTISIANGTSGGASYISVSGVNNSGGQFGTKTLVVYNTSPSYNSICVKDAEGVTYLNITAACTDANEVQVPCTGTASGITCTKSGTTLTISGLVHSAAMQFNIVTPTPTPSPSGSSSSGGGSVGGGAAGATSTKLSTDYVVDIGTANCTVSLKRELVSGNVSVLTTNVENKGGSECTMADFVFSDTIPDSFASMNEINFTPAYTSREGWKVAFTFPTFVGGESKSITYSVGKRVPPSRVNNFTTVEMSAEKKLPAPKVNAPTTTPKEEPEVAPPAPGSDKDIHGCIGSAGYAWCEAKQKCLRAWEEECVAPAKAAPQEQAKSDNTAQMALIAAVILAGIAIVGAGVYFLAKRKHKSS